MVGVVARSDIETVPLTAPSGAIQSLVLPIDGPVQVPGQEELSRAAFGRVDGDLLIEVPTGARFVVEGYFDRATPPPISNAAGLEVGADVVAALAGTDLASPVSTAATAPIGRVEGANGEVILVHTDGTRHEAEVGTLLSRGDRIETGADGSVGVVFADETTFSLGPTGRATFDDLIYDPESGAAQASFVVQEGAFSFAGGGIAAEDGAFIIKTPAFSIGVDGASGAGRVEPDGAATVTYLRSDDLGDGVLRVFNPGGADLLEQSYETLSVEGFFAPPSGLFRLGPREAAEHFGDAISWLPDAEAIMPDSLLRVRRSVEPSFADSDEDDFSGIDAPADLRAELHTDPDTAFEIAARKAAIAQAARDAADEALGDAAAAEQAARAQAAQADQMADQASLQADQLRDQALDVLAEAERRNAEFEAAIQRAQQTAAQEDSAARDVAETDLAQGQAAERLAAAEEAVRRALEAAKQARTEALAILEEAKAKEEAFAAAQQAAQQAQAEEEARALAVAEADAAEAAAAAALRAAEAAAEMAARDAEVAERIAQEAGTAAEVVENAVERELAAIDPDLLRPPEPGEARAVRGDWVTLARASMDVDAAALAAGRAAAQQVFADAIANGSSVQSAMEKAIAAAERYGGASSVEIVVAEGPDGLLGTADDDGLIAGGDGGFVGDLADAGVIDSDVLIGGAGEDGLVGGFGRGGLDGLFGFNRPLTSVVFTQSDRRDDDNRNDDIFVAPATVFTSNLVVGSIVADLLVGSNAESRLAGLEGDDFLYGDTPTNYLVGTHSAAVPLTVPTFDTGADDIISGGAGDDTVWGGDGADILYGDVPADNSAFGFDLGSATPGSDHLLGGDGDDSLYGQGGADTLDGEAGDDTFFMGDDDAANDQVRGGNGTADAGSDTVDYSGAGAGVAIDLGAGTATGTTVGSDNLSGIENAIGSGFADTLTGSILANTLSGGGGGDTISGAAGADNIFGYADDDVLIGGIGDDTITGGDGADTFQFEGGTGATTVDEVASLGHDIISDYNASESDLFMLSHDDFDLGNTGTLTDGANYFEADTMAIDATPQDVSGGAANAGIVVLGAAMGGGDAEVWYTADASAMTDSNSYQIATVNGADRSSLDAGDFHLKA